MSRYWSRLCGGPASSESRKLTGCVDLELVLNDSLKKPVAREPGGPGVKLIRLYILDIIISSGKNKRKLRMGGALLTSLEESGQV